MGKTKTNEISAMGQGISETWLPETNHGNHGK